MLPRTARAGLLARRQFHSSSIQLATSRTSKIVKVIPTLKAKEHAIGQLKVKQKEKEQSAEEIARNALMNFFRSSPPAQLKAKAAQARHYGTLSTLRKGLFLSEEIKPKKKGDDAKAQNPASADTPEERIRQKERIDEATGKEGATDKMKEDGAKDDKEVRLSMLLSNNCD